MGIRAVLERRLFRSLVVLALLAGCALAVAPLGASRGTIAPPGGRLAGAPLRLVAARSSSERLHNKSCYAGTHRERRNDSAFVKSVERRGTVACEQPPKPNLASLIPSAVANLG